MADSPAAASPGSAGFVPGAPLAARPDVRLLGEPVFARVMGQGPHIVLVHGLAVSGEMYAPVADQLAGDHQLIIPDLRGQGRSATMPGTMTCGTTAARGIRSCCSSGAPMGAAGFAALAGQFADRTVVTYDPRGTERSQRTDGEPRRVRHRCRAEFIDVAGIDAAAAAGQRRPRTRLGPRGRPPPTRG